MVSVTIASSSSGMEQPTAVVSKETTTTTASTSLDESPEESLSSNAFPPPSHNDYYSYYVLPKCNLPPASEYTPVETFVYQTIQEQTQQCHETTSTTTANTTSSSMPPVVLTTAYKTLLEALKQTTDPKLLTNILLALRTSGNGATLHLLAANASKHARLIHTLVRLHPFEKKENRWNKESRETDNDDNNNNNSDDAYLYSVADAHLHLLLALVSANSVFLIPTLTTLWKLLALEYEEDVTEARTHRLHAAIASLLRLCPKGKTELFSIIASNAPYRTRPEAAITWYYQHSLTVLHYLPSIQSQVLELIVDKCLEMDVEIIIEDNGGVSVEEKKDDDDDAEDDNIFALDDDDDDVIVVASPSPEKPAATYSVTVDEMANKLDSLMLLLFQYSDKESGGASSTLTTVLSLYDIYARAFESSVLITHKSKFVQFLILYICGKDTTVKLAAEEDSVSLYRVFAAKLIDFLLDPYRATVIRQTAACYLASFVSRASFVCIETVCESVSALLRWAEVYLQSVDISILSISDAKGQCSSHSLFYTVCQSAFYIMCFRGPEALSFFQQVSSNVAAEDDGDDDDDDDNDEPLDVQHIDISPSRWQNLCSSPMQPLRFCLESVQSEFLQLARLFGLLEPGTLERLFQDDTRNASATRKIKKKAPTKIMTAATLEKERQTGGVGGLGKGRNPLESFFPFDPYLLRRSHVYIEPFYTHWPGSIEDRVARDFDNGDDDDDGSVMAGDITEDEEVEEDASDSESDGGSRSDSDEDDDDDDDDDDDEDNRAEFEPMSLASNAGGGGFQESLGSYDSPIASIRDGQRNAWTDILKRNRAPSMENGSW